MADGSSPMDAFIPSAGNTQALRAAFGQFATGVTLMTTQGPNGPMGFIANSFSSLSLDPALIMWALAKSSRRYAVFAAAPQFAVHILGADQAGLLNRFGRDGQGFDGLAHQIGAEGLPLLEGVLARLECRNYGAHDGGDHQIILGQVQRVTTAPGAPLIFAQGKLHPAPMPS